MCTYFTPACAFGWPLALFRYAAAWVSSREMGSGRQTIGAERAPATKNSYKTRYLQRG